MISAKMEIHLVALALFLPSIVALGKLSDVSSERAFSVSMHLFFCLICFLPRYHFSFIFLRTTILLGLRLFSRYETKKGLIRFYFLSVSRKLLSI